jgi:hypothetical protein
MICISGLMIAAAFAGQPEAADDSGNLLVNASFEETLPERPAEVNPHVLGEWWSFAGPKKPYWRHFEIDDNTAYDGERSTKLTLDSTGFDGATLIVGATQNVVTDTMPTELSGAVRVDEWQRGTQRQYVQIVVIVWNVTDNMPKGQDAKNYQIAYTFAGIERPPFRIKNRKFLFPRGELVDLHSEDGNPKVGEWKQFHLNPRKDFNEQWGVDPSDYEYIRVLYEVRYDGRNASKEPPASAVVHWDDLYFGQERTDISEDDQSETE